MKWTQLLLGTVMAALSFSVAGFGDEGEESYQASYFDKYSPQTALDIVKNVPGFRLTLDKDDIRGFGATAGNVLIDGKRPSSKSAGIEEALKRIPASKVEKVVVIRGNSSLSQTSGQSVIVNVIQLESLAASRVSVGIQSHSKNHTVSPNLELSSSATLSGWRSSVNFNVSQNNYGRDTTGTVTTLDTGATQAFTEKQEIELTDAFVSADTSKEFSAGRLSFTSQLGSSKYVPVTERQVYVGPTTENLATDFYNKRVSEYFAGEFGADWEQSFADTWNWKLIGLFNWQNWWVDAGNSLNSNTNDFISGNQYRFDESKDEKVLRTIVANKVNDTFSFDFGGELTVNRLDSGLTLHSLQANGELGDLLSSNATYVTEDRSELFVNTTFNVEPFILRIGLNYEQSSISVDGEAKGDNDLSFLKPFLGLTYNLSEKSQLRLNYKKEVGQLDFSDFAASVDLLNDRDFSSNAQLKPDQKKALVLSYDHQLGADSVISVSTFYEKRRDVLEQVLLPNNQQTLGNAGDATAYGGEVLYTTPLNFIGLENALLDLELSVTETEFEDPLTGEERELTASKSPEFTLRYRHDLELVSWGLEYRNGVDTDYYYVAEYEKLSKDASGLVFIEWSRWQDSLLRFEVSNVDVPSRNRARYFYDIDRSNDLESRQSLDDDYGFYASLTFSYSF